MSSELWREVPGYAGLYEVSSLGRLRSLPREVMCSDGATRRHAGGLKRPTRERSGYLLAQLYRENKRKSVRIHQLVLLAFVGPCPEGMLCRHLDGDPSNNRLDNLAWGTPQENSDDKARHGTVQVGERHHGSRLTRSQVALIRERVRGGEQYKQVALSLGVHPTTVRNACVGVSWTHVGRGRA